MEEYPSPAEGIGLENRQGLNGPRGSNPSSSAIIFIIAGWSSSVARRAHNPKVGGSNPPPAIYFRSRSVAVNTPACHAGDRGFDSRRDRHYIYGSVAQLVEQWIEAPCVGSSTLS